MRVAGIMSGTSLDGIDVAVVDIHEHRFSVVAYRTFPYPAALRSQILAVSNAQTHTSEISKLNFALAERYAKAVRDCGVKLSSVKLIGSHGQTIYHDRSNTLQIGDGSVIAERLGIPCVSDFRTRDMAAGGRGAPLVPFLDYFLYRDEQLGRVALNLGGIANITAIPKRAKPHQVMAFDTGPGNMVIDQLVAIQSRGKQTFDKDGKLAAKGKVNRQLLNVLLKAPYYRQFPPKTAGREQYGREFVAELRKTGLPILDLITTATAFTAATVAQAVQRFVPFRVDELVASGGGTHNRQLMGYLQAFLPDLRLRTSSEFGVDVDAKEAIAFAILAYET